MPREPRPVEALSKLNEAKYVERGLVELGLHADSHKSVLHLWARRLPQGMFDGHQSALPAPDHLTFHGLTKRLVTGIFALLSKEQRKRVGLSLKNALARSHFASSTIYKEKTDAVVSVGISEWAATLTVVCFVFRRVLNRAQAAGGAPISPLLAALEVVDAYTALINALYFFPRADVDGEAACRSRHTADELLALADRFFTLVCAACLRRDTAAFGRNTDVPNLHRLRELLQAAIRLLLHVRHVQKLLFESADQPLKRAITSGNGRDDASLALRRMLQGELASRIALQPAFFGIDHKWPEHDGVRAHLHTTKPLWSQPGGAWRCSGGKLLSTRVPAAAREQIKARWHKSFVVAWKGRATRGDDGRLVVEDCVGVLVLPGPARSEVCVARGEEARGPLCRTAYFRTVTFLDNPSGFPAAVVQALVSIPDSSDVCVDLERFLYLPLIPGVRRALILHSCCCSCSLQPSGSGHSSVNRWRVFGRPDGFPTRSG